KLFNFVFVSVPAKVVWGIPGKDVDLPCDVSPPVMHNNVTMVFWFKDGIKIPLYSLDARGGSLSAASHLAMSDDLGARSFFITDEDPANARLRIHKVNIHDQGVFRCRVDFVNSPTKNFQINLTLVVKPNKVKIVTENSLLSTQKSQNIRCESSGSHPPAKLTWLLDGKPIRNAVVTEEVTDAFTGCIISLNVSAEDDGKELVCRADNPRFPGGYAEDARQIHVAYPPRVAVKMDSESVGGPIKEGTDVILRCDTSAQPTPHSYSWYQDVKGQDAPHCKKGYEIMRVGMLPLETLVIQCHVDAVPRVTRFSWTYNTSRGVLPVQGAKMQNTGNLSVLHFNPGTEDLESLSCWATNEVGRQQTPCLFYIVPAVSVKESSKLPVHVVCKCESSSSERKTFDFSAAPESPKSCILRNASHGGLEVSCIAGKDGGLHQSFVLEVTDISIPTLPPGVTTLSDQELDMVERKNPSDDSISRPGLTVILVGLTALAALLIVGIVAAAAVIACRRPPAAVRRRRREASKPPSELELSEAGFGEGFHRRSAQYRASMYGETEERISRLIEGT
ncbi:unnamed protein product, partial [Brassicogethes aeneus]